MRLAFGSALLIVGLFTMGCGGPGGEATVVAPPSDIAAQQAAEEAYDAELQASGE